MTRELEINELALRQILAATQAVLRQAGVLGIVPTPLDTVAAAAGIRQLLDVDDIPPELAAKKPRAWRRIIGAVLPRERTIFIDRAQAEPRIRFTQGHEITHDILPWQRASYWLDNEHSLDPRTRAQYEVEANVGAAHLLFQGPAAFIARALSYQVSISTALTLSDDYGTSCHATIRYYVEHHPDAVALLVVGRIPHVDGRVPVIQSMQSRSFLERYGEVEGSFPDGKVGHRRGEEDPYGAILTRSRLETAPQADVQLHDLRGGRRDFIAEAFFNGRVYLVMLSERRARRFGRRIEIVTPGNGCGELSSTAVIRRGTPRAAESSTRALSGGRA